MREEAKQRNDNEKDGFRDRPMNDRDGFGGGIAPRFEGGRGRGRGRGRGGFRGGRGRGGGFGGNEGFGNDNRDFRGKRVFDRQPSSEM